MKRRTFIRTCGEIMASSFVAQALPLDSAVKSNKQPAATGFVFDQEYLKPHVNAFKPETPQRLNAIIQKMHSEGIDTKVVLIKPLDNAAEYLELCHTPAHIKKINALADVGKVASLAVGGTLAGVKAVCEGIVNNAFCAIRPPGHHASNTGREEGFCYYNNVALAARYAQKICGYQRILIIDWDYHHGNGTESFFYSDPSVLYFSTFDSHAYPNTGKASRKGDGSGLGYTINVPLKSGSGDREIVVAWEQHLLPAVASFKPDFVLISAGFDSRQDDYLGRFNITDIGYVKLTKMAIAIALKHCSGRVVSVLEGGYNPDGVATAACAHVRALAGLI